jgi:hypothetical protein
MSQSALDSYSLASWTFGYSGGNNVGIGPNNYAPVNILSSGSRWSPTKKIILANLSMSVWYGYDHNIYIVLNSIWHNSNYSPHPHVGLCIIILITTKLCIFK